MSVSAVSPPGKRRPRPARLPRPRAERSTTPSPAAVTVTPPAGAPHLADALRDLVELVGDADHLTQAAVVRALADAAGGPHRQAAPAPDDVHLDAAARTATRHGREIALSRREFDLLLFLARNPGRVFSRGQLLDAAWGHTFTGERTVDVHVARLRSKIRTELPLITTVRGVGYRLTTAAPVTVTGVLLAESTPSAVPRPGRAVEPTAQPSPAPSASGRGAAA